jgi:septal ring factor EnvC (AmiA/AmiB activator)
VSGPSPEETTPSARRFRLRVAPKSSASLTIEEVHPLEARTAVSTLTDRQVTLILNGQALSPAAQQSLQAIRAQKADLATVAAAIGARDDERERIDKDQERVRENLKALQSASSDRSLVERYARQLAAQEDRLEVLRRESDDLGIQQRTKEAELDRLLRALVVDVNVASATAPEGTAVK